MPNFTYSFREKRAILDPFENRLSVKYYRESHSNILKIFETLENFNEDQSKIIIECIFRKMTNDEIMKIVHQFLINAEYHQTLKKLNEILHESNFKMRYNQERKTSYIFDHIKPPGMCPNCKYKV